MPPSSESASWRKTANSPPFEDKKGGWGTVKYKGKWFLTDPEGKLFWSLGINSIQLIEDPTGISYRENYFEELPPERRSEKAVLHPKSLPPFRLL